MPWREMWLSPAGSGGGEGLRQGCLPRAAKEGRGWRRGCSSAPRSAPAPPAPRSAARGTRSLRATLGARGVRSLRFAWFSCLVGIWAQELLINIASLESSVWNLEKDLNELYYQLCHERNERNERLLAESKPGYLPSTSLDDQSLSTCMCTWEEVSFLHYVSVNAQGTEGGVGTEDFKKDYVMFEVKQ
ncbi:hypothetical protein ABZP36_014433 [Zizania latifolia]